MVPVPNLSPQDVAEWLADLASHPVDPDEVRQMPEWNPADTRQDPERALMLEPSGMPLWWPHRNPDTRAPLPAAARRAWCFRYLAGAWSPEQATLRSAAPKSRRLMIARSLLLTLSELNSGELPTPDSL